MPASPGQITALTNAVIARANVASDEAKLAFGDPSSPPITNPVIGGNPVAGSYPRGAGLGTESGLAKAIQALLQGAGDYFVDADAAVLVAALANDALIQAGLLSAQAQLESLKDGIFTFLNGTTLSIPTATNVTLTGWYVTGSYVILPPMYIRGWSYNAGTGVFTCDSPGPYLVEFGVRYNDLAASESGAVELIMVRGGTTAVITGNGSSAPNNSHNVRIELEFLQGDTFFIRTFHSSASSRTVVGATAGVGTETMRQTFLRIERRLR